MDKKHGILEHGVIQVTSSFEERTFLEELSLLLHNDDLVMVAQKAFLKNERSNYENSDSWVKRMTPHFLQLDAALRGKKYGD
jgi:hypothetical protein